jgi:hypothetical protein
MVFNRQQLMGLALLFICAMFVGCGSSKPTAPVAGVVTLKGKTPGVLGLAISFVGPDGQPLTFGVNADGTFKGDGISIGENKVGLRFTGGGLTEEEEEARQKKRSGGKAKEDPIQAAAKAAGVSIPANLQNPQTSGKSFVVEAGKENTFTWDVK